MPWKDDLPENVREWEEVKNSETREAFYDQLGNMRARMGTSINIPGEDASAEDKSAFLDKVLAKAPTDIMRVPSSAEDVMAFYRTQGMPEKDDGYTDPKFEEVPEGVSIDADRIKGFKTLAHKYGLTQDQFEGLTKDFISPELVTLGEGHQTEVAAIAALKDNWGTEFERKSTQAEMIRAAHFDFLPKGLDARTIEAFAGLASKLGVESTSLKNDEGQTGNSLTRDEAKLKISEIMGNKEHPYWKTSDAAHDAARKRIRELNVIAYN